MSYKYVNKAEEMPEGEHFAILKFSTVNVYSGYEDRYGNAETTTEARIEYIAYTEKGEWEAEVKRLAQSTEAKKFKAIHVRPAKIAVSVEVKVS